MTNKRLWLASSVNERRMEVMCYGFHGSYNEEDVIIPNIKLNIHEELIYKHEKQSTPVRVESKGEVTTKDWLYLILYLFLAIILTIFLGIFAYLVFRLFEKRDQRAEEIENVYVPMHPLDPSFKCEFKGMSHYEEPRTPPLPLKNREASLPLINCEASTSTSTV